MPRRFRLPRLAPLAVLAVLPASLSAQPGGVGPSCAIDPNSPKELFVVSLALQKAKNATDAAARAAALREAAEGLTKKPKSFEKNRAGQQYMLTMILSHWFTDPTFDPNTTRGALGYADRPDEPIDVLAAIDSAYAALAEAAPECASEIPAMRQNEGWLAVTRQALELAGSDPAAAKPLAERSLRLAPSSPYPHHVLGQIAQVQGDMDGAIGHWNQVVEAAGTDSSYDDLRLNSLYYLGLVQVQQAQGMEGDAQRAKAQAAAGPLERYLAEKPNSGDAANLMNALFEAYSILGDSAKMAGTYARPLATPGNYDDYTLTMGGVLATRANRPDDAIALFGAAVEKNPNQRDALRNLAASHYGKQQFAEMLPPLRQLVSIDPNNPDAWSMIAFAAQGIAQAATGAEKKTWNDSLMFYANKVETIPVKVEVAGFERRSDRASLTLSLEGNAETPAALSVTVEFLDMNGNVVTTATQQVAPIAKGSAQQVQFEGTGEGIAAYRYKPIGS